MIEIDMNETDIRIASTIIEGIVENAEEYMREKPSVADLVSASDIANSRLLRIAKHILIEIGEDNE